MTTSVSKILRFNSISMKLARALSTKNNVVILQTKVGQVAGLEETSKKTNQKFVSFKGIPYAEPAEGELRFAYPVPKQNWTGIRECFAEGPICPQPFTNLKMSDDCLTLNVFTPNDIVRGKLPVMVWFHGGAYIKGCGNSEVFGPDYIINENVVMVSFNYRLGPLGYLTTEDDVIPPNIALADQRLVMQWVQDNIEHFGGDPDNVTIFGESVGGTNITTHLVDPSTKGLYHKAISHSGSTLIRWSTNIDPGTARSRAFKLGSLLGCDTKDAHELVKFLREQHPMALVKYQFMTWSKQDLKKGSLFPFLPVLEPGKPTPRELYKQGRINNVPVILGFNQHEGFWYLNGGNPKVKYEEQLALYNNRSAKLLESVLPVGYYNNEQALKEATDKVKKYYFGDKEISMDTVRQYIDYATDLGFMEGIWEAADAISKANIPVYRFRFSFDGALGLYRRQMSKTLTGVAHGDDINYLFNSNEPHPEPQLSPESKEILTRKRFVKLWTNFAKYGNPTPKEHPSELLNVEWTRTTPDRREFLDLGEELVIRNNTYNKTVSMLRQLYECLDKQNTTLKQNDAMKLNLSDVEHVEKSCKQEDATLKQNDRPAVILDLSDLEHWRQV